MDASTARILNAGGPPCCRILVQDVRRVGEEVGPHVRGGRAGQLTQVVGDLGRRLRQVKYVYDWWKPILARACIMAGRVNASARNSTSGSVRAISASSRSQNAQRLGVRVVHPEDPHPVRHPLPDHPEHLGVDALWVVVEVERVDVLVLLGRVLRVGDPAVGPLGEPLRMLGHPGMIGRGLQRQVDARPPCPAPGCGGRTRRSPPSCPDRGAGRRGRPRGRRWPTASPDRPGRPAACCWRPCGRWSRSGAPGGR